MLPIGNRFESFHEGMTEGHEAGRSKDLLYAIGFLAGFIWGAVSRLRDEGPERDLEGARRFA